MGLLCNDIRMDGRRIICLHTDEPCIFLRYCATSRKYYQTDRAKDCRVKGKKNDGKMGE